MSVRIIAIILLSSIYGCAPVDPTDMAQAYCKCINESENSDYQECEELARSHKEILLNDPAKQQKYADELVNCTNVSR